jgi:hypothetical protein
MRRPSKHPYDAPGLSPAEFQRAVMDDPTVPIEYRLRASEDLKGTPRPILFDIFPQHLWPSIIEDIIYPTFTGALLMASSIPTSPPLRPSTRNCGSTLKSRLSQTILQVTFASRPHRPGTPPGQCHHAWTLRQRASKHHWHLCP